MTNKEYNKLYWDVRNYAYYLCSQTGFSHDYIDLVHDAYIDWYRLKGTNLFQEPKGIILTKIRYLWLQRIRKNKYMKDGVFHTRQFVSVFEDREETIDPANIGYIPQSDTNIIEDVSYNLLKEKLRKGLNKADYNLITKLGSGYTIGEVARQSKSKKMYPQLLNHRVKRLRKKIQTTIL